MGYKIGDKNSQAIISEDQNGQFGNIRIHSPAQLVIGEDYRPFDAVPPSAGTVAAYFAGGSDGVFIPSPEQPNIQDPAKSYPFAPLPVIGSVGLSSNYLDIQKFPFSVGSSATAVTVAELSYTGPSRPAGTNHGHYGSMGLSTQMAGYSAGGVSREGAQTSSSDYFPLMLTYDATRVDKFSFASQTNSYQSPADLTDGRWLGGSVDFPDAYGKGYVAGGFGWDVSTGVSQLTGAYTSMESINFASDTPATLPATLGDQKSHTQTIQSIDNGYFINGIPRVDAVGQPAMPPASYPNQYLNTNMMYPNVKTIDKFSAASETTTTALTHTDNPNRVAGVGISSLEHGYQTGGYGFGPTYTAATDTDGPYPSRVSGYTNGLGQLLYDRNPGDSHTIWASNPGVQNLPTDPRYPGFIPAYGNPTPLTGGGKGFGWFANYSVTNHYGGVTGFNYLNYPAEYVIENSGQTWPPTDPTNPDGAKSSFRVNFGSGGVSHVIQNGGLYTQGSDPALPPSYPTYTTFVPSSPAPGAPATELIVDTWKAWDAPINDSAFTIDKFPFAIEPADSTEVLEFTNHGYDFQDFGRTRESGVSPGYSLFYWNRLGAAGASSAERGYLAGGAGYHMGPGVLLQTGSSGEMSPKIPFMVGGSSTDSNTHTSMITSFPFTIGFSGNSTEVGSLEDDNHQMASFQD